MYNEQVSVDGAVIPIRANIIKNAALNVKFGDSIINGKNVILSDDVMPDEIAKLHKRAYSVHHL